MKIAALAVCLAAIALAGCRREAVYEPAYEPMKLGGPTQQDGVRN
jgi:hypothetical protein